MGVFSETREQKSISSSWSVILPVGLLGLHIYTNLVSSSTAASIAAKSCDQSFLSGTGFQVAPVASATLISDIYAGSAETIFPPF